jgi:hypothetical protein
MYGQLRSLLDSLTKRERPPRKVGVFYSTLPFASCYARRLVAPDGINGGGCERLQAGVGTGYK